MRIAICDDENKERAEIEEMLLGLHDDYILEGFASGEELLIAAVKKPGFDLAFLDIYLKDENGIEIAERLQKVSPKTDVVFLTSSREHAVEAFSIRALHYLIKPLKQEDVQEVFARMGRMQEKRHTLTIKIERTFHVLYQDEILKIESQGHRTIITMTDETVFSIRKPFHEVEEMLDESFLNIKKGVIVSMHHIRQLCTGDCTLEDGTKYLLQRSRKAEIREKYLEFAMKKMSNDNSESL